MTIHTMYQEELKLTEELLGQWFDAKAPVLIDAPPGSGKTHALCDVIHKFAEKKGLMILATAPRKETVANIKKECADCKRIRTTTIQALESMDESSMLEYINGFQILVLDEIHAMVSDEFAEDNHIFMESVIEEYEGLLIGMTGTNYFRLEYLFSQVYGKMWTTLKVADDFGFLQNNIIIFYKSDETAKYIIENAVNNGEKVFVGCDYIEDLEKLRQGYEENSFVIVSEGSKKNSKMCKKSHRKHLLATGHYPHGKNILFCTRAYELGTNINDDVRTILLHADDLTSIMQFARRVRTTQQGQQVKIYVRAFNAAEITLKSEEADKMLRQSKLYKEDRISFWAKNYRKVKDPSGILYPAQGGNGEVELRIDRLKEAYWKKRKEVFCLQEMHYWVYKVCSIFGDCAFKVLSRPQLVEFMERNEENRLTREQQKELKQKAGEKTIAGINRVCAEEGIEQRVITERENIYVNGKRTQPRVWKITKSYITE